MFAVHFRKREARLVPEDTSVLQSGAPRPGGPNRGQTRFCQAHNDSDTERFTYPSSKDYALG